MIRVDFRDSIRLRLRDIAAMCEAGDGRRRGRARLGGTDHFVADARLGMVMVHEHVKAARS